MSNDSEPTSRGISLRTDHNLSTVRHSLISRGLQDLLTAAPPSMPSVQTDDIHEGATKGDIEAVRRILNADPAKVDATDDDGWAPLHCAVCEDRVEIVELLLMRGAGADARLATGVNRILKAYGEPQCFLDFGQFSGALPLHLAALLGRDACACHLLPTADVGVADDGGYQPLHYAAGPPNWYGHANDASTVLVAERLVTCGADIDAKSSQSGITPIHIAARDGHIDMLLCLIRHGADVDSIDYRQWTPLHHGAQHAHSDVLGLLLENGALVDAVGRRDSVTPLLVAAGSGDAQTVRTLLEHGALISQSDDSGRTALHWASESGSRETAEVLLEYGTDVDARGRDGCSPLHVAANCCEDEGVHIVELIEWLLSNGADVNALDVNGCTPLDWANNAIEALEEETVADFIRQRGGVSGKADR